MHNTWRRTVNNATYALGLLAGNETSHPRQVGSASGSTCIRPPLSFVRSKKFLDTPPPSHPKISRILRQNHLFRFAFERFPIARIKITYIMSYHYDSSSYNGWGDVDSRDANTYSQDSDTDHYDGLEMRSSRPPTSPSTFGPGTRKTRPALGAPFRQGSDNTSYDYRQPSTSSTSSSDSYSSEQHCCSSSSRRDPITGDHIRGETLLHQQSKPGSRYDDPTLGEWAEPNWVEPLSQLSPRPTRKRNSLNRPGMAGLRSNTRTSFTAEGDRVEEYTGEGSLRIGTHWVDEDEAFVQAPTGLQARGASKRRDGGVVNMSFRFSG